MNDSILRDCLAAPDADGTLKMNKRGLITYLARTNDVSYCEAETMYEAVMGAIRDTVASNVRVSLAGFGVFYLQTHRGQKVQFRDRDPAGVSVGDYLVFKFSASKTLNRRLRGFAQLPACAE